MTKGGTIILALTPSRRALGYAVSDNLGLIDADYLNLHDCRTERQRHTRIEHWLRFTIRHVQPTTIVVERIDKRRLTDAMRSILARCQAILADHPHVSQVRSKRKDALQAMMLNSCKTQQQAIRDFSKTISLDCSLLRFHPPPKSTERQEWDRTWGQAVAAAVIALHAKTNHS